MSTQQMLFSLQDFKNQEPLPNHIWPSESDCDRDRKEQLYCHHNREQLCHPANFDHNMSQPLKNNANKNEMLQWQTI